MFVYVVACASNPNTPAENIPRMQLTRMHASVCVAVCRLQVNLAPAVFHFFWARNTALKRRTMCQEKRSAAVHTHLLILGVTKNFSQMLLFVNWSQYTDNTQLYLSLTICTINTATHISLCLAKINTWRIWLKQNPTEFFFVCRQRKNTWKSLLLWTVFTNLGYMSTNWVWNF